MCDALITPHGRNNESEWLGGRRHRRHARKRATTECNGTTQALLSGELGRAVPSIGNSRWGWKQQPNPVRMQMIDPKRSSRIVAL